MRVDTTELGTLDLTANQLCFIAIWAFEASERYSQCGSYSLAKAARDTSIEIHNALEAHGFFDDVKV